MDHNSQRQIFSTNNYSRVFMCFRISDGTSLLDCRLYNQILFHSPRWGDRMPLIYSALWTAHKQ